MKGISEKWGNTKLGARVCVILVALALVVTSFAAAFTPAEAMAKKAKCKHKSTKIVCVRKDDYNHYIKEKCKKCGKTVSNRFGYRCHRSGKRRDRCAKCGAWMHPKVRG